MLQFSAKGFFWVGQALRSIRLDCYIGCTQCANGKAGFALSMDLDQHAKDKALGHLPDIEKAFRFLGLSITADTVKELEDSIVSDKRNSFQWLLDSIDGIERLAEKELKGKFFLYIPPERLKCWPSYKSNDPGVFGKQVDDKFPSAKYDIRCAGMAIGTALSTAAVFHLMRVMEIGLTALGKVFGVSLAYTNWEPAIAQIESRVAGMRSDPTWKSLPDCKEQQEYYSQAVSYLRTVKDAWRNYTMHARAKYTEEEAEQIFNAVKGFIRKLAEKVSE